MPRVNAPRRRDRAVADEEWIRGFLTRAPMGVLGVADQEHPYLNANLFVYEAATEAVYVHTSSQGRLPALTASPTPGSFTAFEMGRLLPATRAFEFSAEYASVVATGTVDQVQGPEEKTRVLRSFMDKYATHLEYGLDYEGVTPEDLPKTAVHRLRIETWSGKRNAPVGRSDAYPYVAAREERST